MKITLESTKRDREIRIENKEGDKERAKKLGWTHLYWEVFYDRWYGMPPGEVKSPIGVLNQVEHWTWGSTGVPNRIPQ